LYIFDGIEFFEENLGDTSGKKFDKMFLDYNTSTHTSVDAIFDGDSELDIISAQKYAYNRKNMFINAKVEFLCLNKLVFSNFCFYVSVSELK